MTENLIRLSMPAESGGRPLWNSSVDPSIVEWVRDGDEYIVVAVEDDANTEYLLNHPDVVEFDEDGFVKRIEAPEDARWESPGGPESRPAGREVFDISEREVNDKRVVEREVPSEELPEYFDWMPGGRPGDGVRIINEVTAEGGSVPLARSGYYVFPEDSVAMCDIFAINTHYTDDKRLFHSAIRFSYDNYDEFEPTDILVYSDRENKLGWIDFGYERVSYCGYNDGAAWYRRVE